MKHLTTLTRPSSKNILRYKYERIPIIGPACGRLFNCNVENSNTSTLLGFGNIISIAIKRTRVGTGLAHSVYERLKCYL